MGFNILEFVGTFLGGLNVPDIGLKADAWLEENGAKYPDAQELTDNLAAFLKATIIEAEPNLNPEAMTNTIKGIAADIINGRAGIDRKAGDITG